MKKIPAVIPGSRPFVFFYFLMGYIFIAFAWWMLLLISISHEAYEEKRELLELNYTYQNLPKERFESSAELLQLDKERRRKERMIIGEGAFFLLVLGLMTWMMHRSLRRETAIARLQKNFLLSITHELRSPIASSKVAMQTLSKHHQLPEEKRKMLISNSIHDMERLQGLVENLLLAAKIEDHQFISGKEPVNLSSMITQVIEKVRETLGPELVFETSLPSEIFVIGDRIGLTSVVANLLENAAKYSSSGKKIRITLEERNREVILRVADHGPGIPDGEKKKVFRKFYRIGQEETRETKGTGLGLYIVEKVLQMHRGSVRVLDNQPRGTVFEVALPKTI
jgi:K+-sensing histidine kinase KdpD